MHLHGFWKGTEHVEGLGVLNGGGSQYVVRESCNLPAVYISKKKKRITGDFWGHALARGREYPDVVSA